MKCPDSGQCANFFFKLHDFPCLLSGAVGDVMYTLQDITGLFSIHPKSGVLMVQVSFICENYIVSQKNQENMSVFLAPWIPDSEWLRLSAESHRGGDWREKIDNDNNSSNANSCSWRLERIQICEGTTVHLEVQSNFRIVFEILLRIKSPRTAGHNDCLIPHKIGGNPVLTPFLWVPFGRSQRGSAGVRECLDVHSFHGSAPPIRLAGASRGEWSPLTKHSLARSALQVSRCTSSKGVHSVENSRTLALAPPKCPTKDGLETGFSVFLYGIMPIILISISRRFHLCKILEKSNYW